MIATLQCVVIDCPRPRELAAFYRRVLGGEVDKQDPRWSTDATWSTLHTPDGRVLAFQQAPDLQPPAWPDPSRPQQYHLDLGVADLDAAEAGVLEAGATLLDAGDPGRCWRVYADPVGHPFCLVQE
ncbi:VOC family protein [Streptomyces sp. UH6]|uniref:VOC family protein n=1 Tax=Streptomyces sp. UH6 TaxID=2748379 RepID=UPI0015D497D3|nr:VOC family protein [Streptomyces sp. UH6]NYV75995.1 VOC family protein [Streptomyces sp. UH6]